VNKAEYRNVDKIQTPNKQLLKLIPEYSNRLTLPKLETSANIAQHMDLDGNTSESFNHTIRILRNWAIN